MEVSKREVAPIKFEIEGEAYEIHTKDFLGIGEDLNASYHKFGHLWSLSCELLALIRTEREKLRREYAKIRGRKYLELKSGDFKENYGIAKPTEDGLEHALAADKELLEFKRRMDSVEEAHGRLWDLRDGMKMKLELLKEIGAFVRQGRKLDT